MNFEICFEITEAVYFHRIKFCTFTRMLLCKTKRHNDDIVSLLLIGTEYQRKLRFATNILIFYSIHIFLSISTSSATAKWMETNTVCELLHRFINTHRDSIIQLAKNLIN